MAVAQILRAVFGPTESSDSLVLNRTEQMVRRMEGSCRTIAIKPRGEIRKRMRGQGLQKGVKK